MLELRDTPVEPRRRKRRREWRIVGGVLFALGGALAFAAWNGVDAPAPDAGANARAKPPLGRELGAERQAEINPVEQVEASTDDRWIDDDGKTLWASPTDGPPLELAYLPPGVEIVLAVRPRRLLAHPEAEKVVAALGPLGAQAIDALERSTGTTLDQIDRLVIGWQIARDGSPVATLVVSTSSRLPDSGTHYQPEGEQGRVTVIGPPTALEEVRILAGRNPPLTRDLERALAHTDRSRDVTLLVRPRTILSDASNMLAGPLSLLRPWLESMFDGNIAAAALSLNWGDDFFIELVAVPTLESSPEQTSAQLAGRVDELPARVESFVLALQTEPYGRRVIARLPEMTRRLAAYTRHGFDREAAVLRCYLPAAAGHNLMMAAELALAEGQVSDANRTILSPVAEATSPARIVEKLQAKTALRFDREELEAALDMLARDLGVPIEIRGPDLQADGITRNQLFGIDMTDRSGEEILVEILRRANPDKLASGPGDPRQKLVYVVGPDAITITTRAAATARGDELPAVFQLD